MCSLESMKTAFLVFIFVSLLAAGMLIWEANRVIKRLRGIDESR